MEGILAVLDPDEEYGRRLCGALNNRKKLACTAVSFTSADTLREYSAAHSVAAVLDASGSDLAQPPEVIVIRLTGNAGEEIPEGVPTIRKYQPVENIVRDLARIVPEAFQPESGSTGAWPDRITAAAAAAVGKTGSQAEHAAEDEDGIRETVLEDGPVYGPSGQNAQRAAENPAQCTVTAVWSPCGRCGKTSFALTFAQLCARRESTLYMNFEEVSGLSAIFPEAAGGGSLADAVFDAQAGTLADHLSRLCFVWHGVSVLRPVPYPEDIYGIPDDKFVQTLQALRDSGQFDRIVLEAGTGLRLACRLFALSRNIYVPFPEDSASGVKRREMEAWFGQGDRRKILRRMKFLRLPAPEDRFDGRISLENLLRTDFGKEVQILLQKEYGERAREAARR